MAWPGDSIIRVLTVYSVGRYYMDGAVAKGLVTRGGTTLFEDFINKRFKRKQRCAYTWW